jgi:hypothetical protein
MNNYISKNLIVDHRAKLQIFDMFYTDEESLETLKETCVFCFIYHSRLELDGFN